MEVPKVLPEEQTAATKRAASETGCCNQTGGPAGHRVEVQFSSKVVQNEYIVTFVGYFSAEEREEHIKRALNGSTGSVSVMLPSSV